MKSIVNVYHSLRRSILPPSINDTDWRYKNLIQALQGVDENIVKADERRVEALTTISHGLNFLCSRAGATAAYAARAEIERVLDALRGDERRLELYGFKVYSQGDEDGIIEEICRRLSIDKGRFCEIGVECGLECNSHYLIHKGWSGVWIEGNSAQERPIHDKFGTIIPSRLRCEISFVTRENINRLLAKHGGADQELDFLSIDVDGNDIYLFEALEARPKIICVEYNSKFPPHVRKQQVYDPDFRWNGTDYFGASLSSFCDVANRKGYRLVGTNVTGVNAFFVRADLVRDLFTEVDNYRTLYNPPRYYLIPHHYHFVGHPADFGRYADLVD